ncbi:MAG: lytic transglycosylase domain-containing protein [Gammaproteobacteria bacterium]|nr:lytic transglycosylase domain-containing protein [Gammaproteobacteria bacterium]
MTAFLSRSVCLLLPLLLALALSVSATAHAAELTLPLRLPVTVLQESLQDTLGIKDPAPAEIFRQGDCRFIQLEGLKLETDGGRLHVKTHTTLKFGPNWFGSCYGAIDWRGTAQFELEPYITPEHLLRYRLRDTQLIDEQGNKSLAAGLVWKLVARIMQPRLEAFQIDLRPPRSEVTSVLHNFATPSQVEELDRILASARTTTLTVAKHELSVPLVLDIPDHYLAQPDVADTATETPLTAEELASFERTSQAWDAFLVYIIRNLGLDIVDDDIRIRLLEILLNSRYQITAILSGEAEETSADPTRALFVTTWNDLHTLIMDAGDRGQLHGRLLSYLSFLTAGDALFLLDTTAPGLGMEISENGLRRLARAMRPLDKADPLQYDWNLDPFLQDLFDLDQPQTPAPAPPVSPETPTPQSLRWLDLLIPVAQAEAAPHTTPDAAQQLSDQLHEWIPQPEEMDTYRAVVNALLDNVRQRETPTTRISVAEAEIFRHLVPATAMIESCWRQYARENGAVTYVRSPSGSIGMMQINPRVWRGIFDIQRLKNDTGYNVYAGTRILLRYLRLYARPIAARTGTPTDLARASYAAYNAGPRAAGRFLRAHRKSRIRQIDEKFWNLYQAINAGGTVDLQACTVVASPAT